MARDFWIIFRKRLAFWGWVFMLVGVVLLLKGDLNWKWIGLTGIIWGLISVVLTGVDRLRLRKKSYSAADRVAAEEEEAWIKRFLLFSAGLDALLAAGGLFLGRNQATFDPVLAGCGYGVLIFGGFFFLFNLINGLSVPHEVVLPDLHLMDGPKYEGFHYEGGKPGVLVVHGFLGTPDEVRGLGQALNSSGWTVEGVLLPGSGPDLSNLYQRRWRDWAAVVQRALNTLKKDHDPIAIVGYSLGGALAITAAALTPPDALVLLAPYTWEEGFWKRLVIGIGRLVLPVSVRPFRRMDFSNVESRGMVGEILAGYNLDDPKLQQILKDLEVPLLVLDQMRIAGILALRNANDVTCPALIIQGRKDRTVKYLATRRLVARLGGPVVYQEMGSSHQLVWVSEPAFPGVSKMVVGFLAGLVNRQKTGG